MDLSPTSIPKYGFKARLDHTFPQKRSQNLTPRPKQVLPLIPLFLRYSIYTIRKYLNKEAPVMDFLFPAHSQCYSGVPIGGIGGGSIGRGFKGEFCNFQMIPGVYEMHSVPADQFIVTIRNEKKVTVYQKVLSSIKAPDHLKAWDWTFPPTNAEYTGLFPRAWTKFYIQEENIELICRQVSPVIPNNYSDSSIPSCVFEWTVTSNNPDVRYVSITFTFKNGTGGCHDKSGDVSSEFFKITSQTESCEGIVISQKARDIPYSTAIGALSQDNVNITTCKYFDPKSDGSEIWDRLKNHGELHFTDSAAYSIRKGQELGFAVCAHTVVMPGHSEKMSFSLAWDMPKIWFPARDRTIMRRWYTKIFGAKGGAAPQICLYSLINYKNWDAEIYNWQKPILEDHSLPDWFKSALFNELYYVVDGGTIWVIPDDSELLSGSDPRVTWGRFAYLESHEYRMYNTYDVHFYASFALIKLWPHLQISLQYDFRDTIQQEDRQIIWFAYNGARTYRKVKGTVPHDLGDPDEAPYAKINAYPVHDVSQWRDLNLKFVLQVFRDYIYTNNKNFLYEMFNDCLTVMEHALTWDVDGDGLIENSGSPDQTYDAWTMKGSSAYCGSLWIAAVYAFVKISEILDRNNIANKFEGILQRAKKAFESKLWTGEYYRFDSSGSYSGDSVMSDQLCGLWYLRCCHVQDEIFPNSNVQSALKKVFDLNVMKYYGGAQGAVNGMRPDGIVATYAIPSEESWVGVSYALASLLICEGLTNEGFATAKGVYETIYEKSGLGYCTPESLHELTSYRSIGYMRPLSIWSILCALDINKGHLSTSNSLIKYADASDDEK